MKKHILSIALLFMASFGIAQETIKTEKIKAGHRTVYTDIIIDATPDQVWAVLTDTESYPEWSYMLKKIDGTICDSCEIDAYFQTNPNKEKLTKVHHTIAVIEGEEFRWSEVFQAGIKDNHRFRVEPTEDGRTRFIQSDEFVGGATWLMGGFAVKMTKNGYPGFNQALKAEVERRINIAQEEE